MLFLSCHQDHKRTCAALALPIALQAARVCVKLGVKLGAPSLCCTLQPNTPFKGCAKKTIAGSPLLLG